MTYGYMVDSSWWRSPRGGKKYHLPDSNHLPLCGARGILLDGHEDGWLWDEIYDELRCKRCEKKLAADDGEPRGEEP